MEAIPLLCKVCPKEPHFSDISHLLTHVDSKGHLKYYSNAKIRGRDDRSIRLKFDEFNEWYEKHGIERLLSQRILQKDLRTNNAKKKASRDTTAKVQKIPKRSKKKTLGLPEPPLDDGVKDVIDPRLCQLQDPNRLTQLTEEDIVPQSPSPFDITSLHRRHLPSMRSWTPIGDSPQRPSTRSTRHMNQRAIKSDTDADEATEWVESLSPEHSTYPDPSILPVSFPFADTSTPFSTPKRQKASTASPSQSYQRSRQTSETTTTNVVKLKGPHWPGMALFDSASPKAQRLRNQKKEHSMLQQMEYSSTIVEPLERIFFPEWTLKKERPITGNVESSPFKEPTPKPKRRRPRTSRAVLDDLNTNIPKRRARQPPKRATPEQVYNATDTADLFGQRSVETKSSLSCATEASNVPSYRGTHRDAGEWLLNRGLPEFENRRSFSVFRDSTDVEQWKQSYRAEEQPATVGYPFLSLPNARSTNPHHGLPYPTESTRLPYGTSTLLREAQGRTNTSENSRRGAWDQSLRTSRNIGAGKENIEPLMDPNGNIDNEVPRVGVPRVTQRYFSVSGNEPPRFFDDLPSEMEFGGLADRRMMGSSFNPLNPQLRGQSQLRSIEPHLATPISVYEDSRIIRNLTSKNENRDFGRYFTAVPGPGSKRTWSKL